MLVDLRAVDGAPPGSNAAKRAGATRKDATACVSGFTAWKGKVEELKGLMNTAVEILRASAEQ